MRKEYQSSRAVSRVGITEEILTGRGGMTLFVRYLSRVGIFEILGQHFASVRKSAKGQRVWNLFLQVFCFFFDGTSRHLTYFDHLKKDPGYAASLENEPAEMVSSHVIKRFFQALGWVSGGIFRKILNHLFVWRLKLNRPREVIFSIDTMVMDNDDAQKREGVQPTYKKRKGFQPLHMIWCGKIVDAVFRGGKKNGNAGNTVENMLRRMVPLIREACDPALIVVRLDAGFFDEAIIDVCNQLRVGWILTGKMSEDLKETVREAQRGWWRTLGKDRQKWEYVEFLHGCRCWKTEYRAFYTRPLYDERGQGLLEFARPDNVILTNLGVIEDVFEKCDAERRARWMKPETIIESHHGRGGDELPHRGLKDFGFEALPFKRFGANMSFYYCMLISFFLHETYKEDVLRDVIPISSYASTVRRVALDFAAKIVYHSKQIILRVTRSTMERLNVIVLWGRCNTAHRISI